MSERNKTLIILFVLLCGCQRERTVSCSCFDGDDSLSLIIHALNDDIVSIEETRVFVLPEHLLANERYFRDLEGQFDPYCHVEGNKLVRRRMLMLDRVYSLELTMKDLQERRYRCE